ncbi:sensor histidine kinase [Deinococcus roseus]|uniref:histidine kinase n=1 Tax=Deinococcus roseus TaxID=392414 RepID=A0ABQ2CWI9_9DEIO|nr:HAMP domain-containing sensor histidine kinase [Deinococcus roseus]GGJ27651.1 two-component sensor histidine kinase [Deinococcus roseus]
MTLRQRLAAFIAVTTLVALIVQGTLGYLSFQHQVNSSLDRELSSYVERLIGVMRKRPLSSNPHDYAGLNAGFEGYVTRVRLVHEGEVIWQNGDFPQDIPLPALDPQVYQAWQTLGFPRGTAMVSLGSNKNQGNWRTGSWVIIPPAGSSPDFFVQGTIRELHSSLVNYQQTMLLTTLIVTFVGAILALLLSRPALKPLQHLLDTTKEVAHSGNLSLRVPQDGGGELGELSETFNHMLDRLSDFRKRETEFTRNASHELRTPLTAMKLHLGNWKAGYATPEETLETVAEEVDRMTRLSESLLTLAREGRTHKTHFDFAELVRENAESKGVPYSGPEHLTLCGDPLLLRQALLNLFNNAHNHAPEAQVQVSLCTKQQEEQDYAILQVSDTGPGMSEETRAKATETFFRAPGTRAPGSGLGLSVVAQVAQVHEGQVELKENHPSGLIVELWVKIST